MSNPNPPFVPDRPLAPFQNIDEDEWRKFLAMRNQSFDEIMARLKMADSFATTLPGSTPESRYTVADAIVTGQKLKELSNSSRYANTFGLDNESYNDLVGRARRYSGGDPYGKSPEELQQIIMRGRQNLREGEPEPYGRFDEAQSFARAMLSGFAKTTSHISQSIPLLGDLIARTNASKRADQWISEMDEVAREIVPEDDKWAYDTARGIGRFAGYYIPGSVTWGLAERAIGGAAIAGGSLTPAAKMAMKGIEAVGSVGRAATARPLLQTFGKGALSMWMMEGGGDAPWEERALTIGVGGAIPVAFGLVAPYMVNTYRNLDRSFGAWWKRTFNPSRELDLWTPPPSKGHRINDNWTPPNAGPQEPIPEAEWQFVDETASRPNEVAKPPFLIGATETPSPAPTTPPFVEPPATPATPAVPAISVQKITAAIQAVDAAPAVTPEFVPEFSSELPLMQLATDAGVAFRTVATGVPNTTRIMPTVNSAEGPITKAVMFDSEGHAVATAAVLQDGPMKLSVRPDARRMGYGTALLDQLQAGGIDVVDAISKSPLSPEGRATAKSWLGRQLNSAQAAVEVSEPDFVTEAINDGVNLSKQQTIIESPIVNKMAGKTKFDDVDVAEAALETNPGGIAVIRNVGNDAELIARLTKKRSGKLKPSEIRVVERDVRPEDIWAPAMLIKEPVPEPEILHTPMRKSDERYDIENNPPKGKKGYVAYFSNSGMDWGISRIEAPKKGETLNLDANGVIVYAKNLTEAKAIAERMPPLELSFSSFEARARQGQFGPKLQREHFKVIQGGGKAAPEAEPPFITRMLEGRPGDVHAMIPLNYDLPPEQLDQFLDNDGVELGYVTTRGEWATREEASVIKGQPADKARRRPLHSGMLPPAPRVREPILQKDILVSEGLPITNKRVEEYKRFGFFNGEMAVVGGQEVVIVLPGWPTIVKNKYSDVTFPVSPLDIKPLNSTAPEFDIGSYAPSWYDTFKQVSTVKLQKELDDAGLNVKVDWFGPEMTSQLPRLIDEFLSNNGVTNPVTRNAILSYFNVRRVNDYRELADPEDLAAWIGLQKNAGEAVANARFNERLVTALDEEAATSGFALDLNPEGGFMLRDLRTGDSQPAGTEEEVRAFLQNFNRKVPGVMEPQSVPEELLESVPGASHEGTATPPVLTNQAQIASQVDAIDQIVRETLAEMEPEDLDELGDVIDLILARAKTGKNTVGAALDPSLLRKLGANMYKGDPAKVIIKEALQNAVDAIRHLGPAGKVDVRIHFPERTFQFEDNGTGMSPDVMANEFMDPGGSLKPKGASGGYGLAKVGLFSNADKIIARSVWRNGRNVHLTEVSGSGSDWMLGKMKYATKSRPDPEEYETTGTSLKLVISDDLEFDDYIATEFVNEFIRYSKTDHQINFNINNHPHDSGGYEYKPPTMPDKPSESFAVPGADLDIYNSLETEETSFITPKILNNGIFQFEYVHYYGNQVVHPRRIIINVKPTVDTEHNDYPFTTSREELKSGAEQKVKNVLTGVEIDKKSKGYQDLVETILKPVRMIGNVEFGVYRSMQGLDDNLINSIATSPYAELISTKASEILQNMHQLFKSRYGSHHDLTLEPRMGGIGLNKEWLGINVSMRSVRRLYAEIEQEAKKMGIDDIINEIDIPNNNLVLINPFTIISDMSYNSGVQWYLSTIEKYDSSRQVVRDQLNLIRRDVARHIAANTWATLAHEEVHQLARDHREDFAGYLTRFKAMLAVNPDTDAQLEGLTSVWEYILRPGSPFFKHAKDLKDQWATIGANNVFKEVGVEQRVSSGNSGISDSSNGQGQQGMADGGGSSGNGRGSDEGRVRGVPPEFSLTRTPTSYMAGAGPNAGGGGGTPATPIPPFISGAGGEGHFLPPGQAEVAEQFRRRGDMAATALNNYVTTLGFRWFNPTFHAMRKLDDVMQKVLGRPVHLSDQYTDVSRGHTKMRDDGRPWMLEAQNILQNFDRQRIRSGELVRVMEIGDINQTIEAMTQLGYKPRERNAVWALRDYLDRFFNYMVNDPAYTLGDWQYVFGYVSCVRNRQLAGVGASAWDDTENLLPHHLKFFAEESRTGQIDYRELHMGNILGRLIRGAMFHKHVRPAWEIMVQTWDQPEVPEQVRAFIGGFLKYVQRGRDPLEDTAMIGIRNVLNHFGIPATDQDMAALSGGMVGTMYRAYLGLRPDILFREMMQPFMAASKIGYNPILRGYRAFFGGQGAEMTRLAIQKGWIEPGIPRGLWAGPFEEVASLTGTNQPFYAAEDMPHIVARQQEMANRREAWAGFIDHIYNMLPVKARQSLADTKLDPLYAYGKVTTAGKVIAGNAAYTHAHETIAKYLANQINIDQLHYILGTAHYGRPMQQFINEALNRGDAEAAATRYANDVVADAMLKTGGHEQPEGLRNLGTFGKMAFMFGTFSIGTLAWLGSGLGAGARPSARFAARYGALVAALKLAESQTGIKFSRWLYHDALLWSGSPALGLAVSGLQAYRASTSVAQGYPPSAAEAEAVRQFSPERIGRGLASTFVPFAGGVKTVTRSMEAFEGVNPAYYLSRLYLTGERPGAAAQQDAERSIKEYGQDMSKNMGFDTTVPPFILPDTMPGGGAF